MFSIWEPENYNHTSQYLHQGQNFLKDKSYWETKNRSQLLRALSSLSKDVSLAPAHQLGDSKQHAPPAPGDPTFSSGLQKQALAYMSHM